MATEHNQYAKKSYSEEELKIIKSNNQKNVTTEEKSHAMCRVHDHHDYNNNNNNNNGNNALINKHLQRHDYLKQIENDEDIANYIESLLSIKNKQKATILLALFILSKYKSNYLLLPKGIDPVD